LKAGQSTYKARAGDAFQRPLRSRFQARLTRGVQPHCCRFAGFSLSLKLHWRESVEMPWPAFNEFGDLPVGVYRATLAEVVTHFGHGTAHCHHRMPGTHLCAGASYRFLQRFIIFGSYVTAAPNPRDVDIFLVMRGNFQLRDAPPEAQPLPT